MCKIFLTFFFFFFFFDINIQKKKWAVSIKPIQEEEDLEKSISPPSLT